MLIILYKSKNKGNKFNSRCQVDCIDMQSCPDGEFKYIMVYQDHLTKFTMLEALKKKSAQEVAAHLVNIFRTFSAPLIFHGDIHTEVYLYRKLY